MANEFFIPATVITGAGAVDKCAAKLSTFGTKALIVCGKSAVKCGIVDRIQSILKENEIGAAVFDRVSGEPTDLTISDGLACYRENACDFLIGVGGGSPLDSMKAIAMMSVYEGKLADYMGKEIARPLPPMAAIPTTAGTGSETTQFTIITDTESGVKMLLKEHALMPSLAVVDPELSLSTPKSVTVSTGLDALTHAVEAYTSRKTQPLTDVLAVSAVRRIFSNLPKAVEDGSNMEARQEMSLAAFEAGMAFNNSSVTLVHGMSRPIGALFHVPHGISNAMLLTVCLRFAVSGAEERFAALGRAIGAADADTPDREAADRFLTAVNKLCAVCEVPTLEAYGIDRESFFRAIPKMAKDALESGSPGNTRRSPSEEEIETLYRELWA